MAQPFRATPARLCYFSTISRFFDAFASSRGYECSCTWIAVPWRYWLLCRQACSEFSAAQYRRVKLLGSAFQARLVLSSAEPNIGFCVASMSLSSAELHKLLCGKRAQCKCGFDSCIMDKPSGVTLRCVFAIETR